MSRCCTHHVECSAHAREWLLSELTSQPPYQIYCRASADESFERPRSAIFADGVTDELITNLAQISSLRVISHTSAMAYLGTRKPAPQIARELGVDALVEGSVVRSGNQSASQLS